jgi:hypothetical protein
VPGTTTVGTSVTDFFCSAVTTGSEVLNWAVVNPWWFLGAFGLLVLASGEAVRRTEWRPVEPHPLRRTRRGGQMLRAAWRIYKGDLRTFLGMGVIFVPVSIVAAGIQWVLFHLTGAGDFVALDSRHGVATAILALLIGGVGAAIASVCTTAAVSAALGELDAGRRIRAPEAFRIAFHHAGPLAGALARQFGAAVLLTITVIGIPFAIRRFVRWSLFAQAAVLEELPARDALRRSAELVDGYWWRTFGITAFVDIVTALSGPLIGVVLLLVSDSSLNFINVVGSLIYTITVPYAATVLTLYYFDLDARKSGAG